MGAGETVVDVPPKLAARARLLDNGDANQNDPQRRPLCRPGRPVGKARVGGHKKGPRRSDESVGVAAQGEGRQNLEGGPELALHDPRRSSSEAVISLVYLGLCRVLDLLALPRRSGAEKDVELVVLSHQVRVLERQVRGRVRYRPVDRALLAALSRSLPRERWPAFLVTPTTLVPWHRETGRRKWRAWRRQRGPGRSPMKPELVEMIVRMGQENRSWGCVRIQGELRKLGIWVGATSVRLVLRRHGLGPPLGQPRAGRSSSVPRPRGS